MSTENHSVHEANKLLRVLVGERRKYTVRVHHPDGKITEFQADSYPKLKYDDEARALWLFGSDYNANPIMACPEGVIILTEENPKA